MTGLHLNALVQTYESMVQTGKPPEGKVRSVGEQHIVQTYPFDNMDKAFYPGTIELWLEPGNKLINTSAVCASPQLLMLQKDWPHREVFMQKLEAKLRSVSKSGSYPVFYPGTAQRVQEAKNAYPAGKVREISLGADGAPC